MTFLGRVCACLEQHHVPYAIVGGYAVALHGVMRGTFDVDLIIRRKQADFIAVEAAFKSIGLQSRLPVTAKEVFQFRKEYIENRHLIAWSFVNPKNPMELVDVIITDDLDNNSISSKILSGHKIQIISKKDLIKMKKKSGRPQDMMDVHALENL